MKKVLQKLFTGFITAFQESGQKTVTSFIKEAKNGKGNAAEYIKVLTMGKYNLITDIVEVVNRLMPVYKKGSDFFKEGKGLSTYMSGYYQVVGGVVYVRSGSDYDRTSGAQERLNNTEDSASLAAMRASSTYNTQDFFDFDDIFDFSIKQNEIFRAPENFKWTKTTGNIKFDIAAYIMDSLCFYAECTYLSAKNLLTYYPRALKDKVTLIKDKIRIFKSSVTSSERWKEAIKSGDVNKLFLNTTLESSLDKRQRDEQYTKERNARILDAASKVLENRQKTEGMQ